jgi:hypothetical protein
MDPLTPSVPAGVAAALPALTFKLIGLISAATHLDPRRTGPIRIATEDPESQQIIVSRANR